METQPVESNICKHCFRKVGEPYKDYFCSRGCWQEFIQEQEDNRIPKGNMTPTAFKQDSSRMQHDSVESPSHYRAGSPYETILVLEAWGLTHNYYRGNAVKYISRAGRKEGVSPLEDLKKARWYINREIEQMERP